MKMNACFYVLALVLSFWTQNLTYAAGATSSLKCQGADKAGTPIYAELNWNQTRQGESLSLKILASVREFHSPLALSANGLTASRFQQGKFSNILAWAGKINEPEGGHLYIEKLETASSSILQKGPRKIAYFGNGILFVGQMICK
jgi:hypothetical protein